MFVPYLLVARQNVPLNRGSYHALALPYSKSYYSQFHCASGVFSAQNGESTTQWSRMTPFLLPICRLTLLCSWYLWDLWALLFKTLPWFKKAAEAPQGQITHALQGYRHVRTTICLPAFNRYILKGKLIDSNKITAEKRCQELASYVLNFSNLQIFISKYGNIFSLFLAGEKKKIIIVNYPCKSNASKPRIYSCSCSGHHGSSYLYLFLCVLSKSLYYTNQTTDLPAASY